MFVLTVTFTVNLIQIVLFQIKSSQRDIAYMGTEGAILILLKPIFSASLLAIHPKLVNSLYSYSQQSFKIWDPIKDVIYHYIEENRTANTTLRGSILYWINLRICRTYSNLYSSFNQELHDIYIYDSYVFSPLFPFCTVLLRVFLSQHIICLKTICNLGAKFCCWSNSHTTIN